MVEKVTCLKCEGEGEQFCPCCGQNMDCDQCNGSTAISALRELEALRAAIEKAPHEDTCSGEDSLGDDQPAKCDCWKSAIGVTV